MSKGAEEAGIVVGASVAQAQASLPGLHVMEADADAGAAALERLARWALRYTPLVMPDTEGADALILDVTGAAHLHGGERALLGDLLARLGRAGLTARAALADSQAAAFALARFGAGAEAGFLSAQGQATADTAPLPVAALRLPPAEASALRRLGLERIGDLLAAPRAALSLRFGPDLVARLACLRGEAFEPFAPTEVPETLAVRLAFAEPIAHSAGVEGALARLCDELCAALTARGEGARVLDLLCHRVDGRIVALRARCAAAARDPRHLARLFAERLDTIDPGFGIERVVLAAPRKERMHAVQAATGEATAPPLPPLIDRIGARIGPRGVFAVVPTEADMPERSCRAVRPLSPPPAVRWDRSPRPALLIEPPQSVQVLALLPDHPPRRFSWHGRQHRVRRADGPECVMGEWWRADEEVALTRDYYRVETEEGGRYWLFRARDASSGEGAAGTAEWFVHGVFA